MNESTSSNNRFHAMIDDGNVRRSILAQAEIARSGAEIVDLISSAHSDEAAIQALAQRLGIDEMVTTRVLEMQLRRFLPSQRALLEKEARHLGDTNQL